MKVKDILQTTTSKKIFIDKDGATIAVKNPEIDTITEKVESMEVKTVKAGRGFFRIEV